MPLTPRSRVYEQKLERTRKKYESRNAFATERGRKANEGSFSSPAPEQPTLNANLRGANFMRGGLAVEGVKTLLDWDTLKSAYDNPTDTLQGLGKTGLIAYNPALAGAVLGPEGALKAAFALDPDVQKSSAIASLLPMGKGAQLTTKVTEKLAPKVLNTLTKAGEKLGPEGFNAASMGIKNIPQPISAARKVSNDSSKAEGLGKEILSEATSKADQTTHKGVAEANNRAYMPAEPGSRLSDELLSLWRAAGETTPFPTGATSDVLHILGGKQQSPSFASLLDESAFSALPSRGGALRTQGVLVPYSEGNVEGVPLSAIIDYLHLGDNAAKVATELPKSNITGSGLLRVGVEGTASRTARYNKMANTEAAGVRDISESLSGGVPSLAQEPKRMAEEVSRVFSPRDAFFSEGVAPSVIDLQKASDITTGVKAYNIDRIEPKTHAGILEGIANALTKGDMSASDQKFFTDLYGGILSPKNSILTGGSFNQSKSDFTSQKGILNSLITERRKLQEKSGSVYIPKTIEELGIYTDPTTEAGQVYSKLFNPDYAPVLGKALNNIEAFAGHDPALIRSVVEGVQKVRQSARKANSNDVDVTDFLNEVSQVLTSSKKDADKQQEIRLLLDKVLGKVSERQMGLELGM
jgi:hypothetical protein